MAIKAKPGERYTVRRQVFKFLGAGFDVYDAEGNPVGYCKQRAFKLKEDLRVCTDKSMATELFRIRARQVIDWGATYDVTLPGGESLGSFRRKGMKSLFRDHWIVFDSRGKEVGRVIEDSSWMAAARRFVELAALIFPQKYRLETETGDHIATYRQHFNWFVYRLGVAIHREDDEIDDLLVLAGGCLIAAIEGRQG